MKTQAWGWLAAAVMAAGLNLNYHDGGMQWAHEIADRIQHNSEAVLALASGHADQFLAEAQMLTAKRETSSSCPFSAVLAQAQSRVEQAEGRVEMKSGEFEAMSAREEAALGRIEARRARIEVRMANMRIPARMSAMVMSTPHVSVCNRVRVSVPQVHVLQLPMIKMPATPMVHIENPGAGPV